LDSTGLYFYNARYYDAEIGRFISADTIVPDPSNPQTLNRYSYCLNNPLRYIDPSGHDLFNDYYYYVANGGNVKPPSMFGDRNGDGDEGRGRNENKPSFPLKPKDTPPTHAETIPIPVPVIIGESIGSTILGWLSVAGTFILMVLIPTDSPRDNTILIKAPGMPTEKDGFKPSRNWNGQTVKNPNGPGSGYPDQNGDVWVPNDHGGTHAPHWDVEHPGGGYYPVYPK
jgi:RHS repeat-associated protein